MSLKKSKKHTKKLPVTEPAVATKEQQQAWAADIEEYPNYVPEEYIGRLEPNNYCRGWNAKREKYCKQSAGHNTDHKGVGRCAWHGKGGVTTHGRYAKHVGPKLQEHLEIIQEEDGDRTDITQEVDMFRAITAKYIEEFDELVEALHAWYHEQSLEDNAKGRRSRPRNIPDIIQVGILLKDAASLADKIHTQQHRDSIPKRDFFRLQDAMSDVVVKRLRGMAHILGEDNIGILIAGISDDWSEIRL